MKAHATQSVTRLRLVSCRRSSHRTRRGLQALPSAREFAGDLGILPRLPARGAGSAAVAVEQGAARPRLWAFGVSCFLLGLVLGLHVGGVL